MDKFNTGRMYNSTANDCVSKSWAYNKRQTKESESQVPRVQGRLTPSCFHRKSWLKATADSVTKTRVKSTSTSKMTPQNGGRREVQNVRHFETPRTFPNPYAPHLKYGIFSNNRVRPKSPTKCASRVTQRNYTDAMKEASMSDSPYFSVRPLVQEDLEIASRTRAIGWHNEFSGNLI